MLKIFAATCDIEVFGWEYFAKRLNHTANFAWTCHILKPFLLSNIQMFLVIWWNIARFSTHRCRLLARLREGSLTFEIEGFLLWNCMLQIKHPKYSGYFTRKPFLNLEPLKPWTCLWSNVLFRCFFLQICMMPRVWTLTSIANCLTVQHLYSWMFYLGVHFFFFLRDVWIQTHILHNYCISQTRDVCGHIPICHLWSRCFEDMLLWVCNLISLRDVSVETYIFATT